MITIKSAEERHAMMVAYHKAKAAEIETNAEKYVLSKENDLDALAGSGEKRANLICDVERNTKNAILRIYQDNGFKAYEHGRDFITVEW